MNYRLKDNFYPFSNRSSSDCFDELVLIIKKQLIKKSIITETTQHQVIWHRKQAFSEIFCLAFGDGPSRQNVVIKKIIHTSYNRGLGDAWDKPRAHIEFEILERLYKGFKDNKEFGVPKPLLLLPEHDTLVVEHCSGPELGGLFYGAKHFIRKSLFQQLRTYIIRVGKWAKRFNELTEPALGGSESVKDIVLFCKKMLQEISTTKHHCIPEQFSHNVFSQIIKLCDAIQENSVPVARKHDDFGPWNMIASPSKLIVIDFAAEKRGPCCSDLLKMLVFFSDLEQNPIFSKSKLSLLHKELLSAYGSSFIFPNHVLAICEAKHRISSAWHCVMNPPPTVLGRYVSNKILRKHVDWLTNISKSPLLWNRF